MKLKDFNEIYENSDRKTCPFCSGNVDKVDETPNHIDMECQACNRVWAHYKGDGDNLADFGTMPLEFLLEANRSAVLDLYLDFIKEQFAELKGDGLLELMTEKLCRKERDVERWVDKQE